MDIMLTNLQTQYPVPLTKIKKRLSKIPVKFKDTVQLLEESLRGSFLGDEVKLSIVFVSAQRMQALNKKFLGHVGVTDVITFNHGEIVVCPSQAKKNARVYGQSYERELLLYCVHGLLHLAGYRDHRPKDIKAMRAMERVLMQDMYPL